MPLCRRLQLGLPPGQFLFASGQGVAAFLEFLLANAEILGRGRRLLGVEGEPLGLVPVDSAFLFEHLSRARNSSCFTRSSSCWVRSTFFSLPMVLGGLAQLGTRPVDLTVATKNAARSPSSFACWEQCSRARPGRQPGCFAGRSDRPAAAVRPPYGTTGRRLPLFVSESRPQCPNAGRPCGRCPRAGGAVPPCPPENAQSPPGTCRLSPQTGPLPLELSSRRSNSCWRSRSWAAAWAAFSSVDPRRFQLEAGCLAFHLDPTPLQLVIDGVERSPIGFECFPLLLQLAFERAECRVLLPQLVRRLLHFLGRRSLPARGGGIRLRGRGGSGCGGGQDSGCCLDGFLACDWHLAAAPSAFVKSGPRMPDSAGLIGCADRGELTQVHAVQDFPIEPGRPSDVAADGGRRIERDGGGGGNLFGERGGVIRLQSGQGRRGRVDGGIGCVCRVGGRRIAVLISAD